MKKPKRKKPKKSLYTVLGLEPTCTPEEVKEAFRRLAKELHPDRNPGDDDSEARYKEVSLAYEVLIDPKRRAEYDKSGGVRAPHQKYEPIAGYLEEALKEAVRNVVQSGSDKVADQLNMVDKVRQYVSKQLRDNKERLAGVDKTIHALTITLGRWKVTNEETPNLLEALARERVEELMITAKPTRKRVERLELCLEYLTLCVFDKKTQERKDNPLYSPLADSFFNRHVRGELGE